MEQIINLTMIKVEGGSIDIICHDVLSCQNTKKIITVSGFYIGIYVVTQNQWQEIMGKNPEFDEENSECPIINICLDEIRDFLSKLNQKTGKNYRLPNNTEWEYAAKGGNQSHSYIYSGSNNLEEVGWFNNNSTSQVNPVGRKKPNELGLFDMSGNVWELCNDNYNNERQYSYNPLESIYEAERVLRGGSWKSNISNCRNTHHISITNESIRSSDVGIRLVLPI
ncbi:MAG: SUMF1/EgtB/PvdO family nonheme iron enzyme [Bacteroidetes bacterium]|nr:SUMF1/EgtB/PvdO family nonheme iron enzyme [Bacteroidota bacterium]